MKKERKYLWVINTILFLIVSIFVFIKLSYLFRPVSINRINIVGYYAEEENTIDVVAIGGSSTYVFWAPYDAWNAEGIVSYDFSSDSMSPALLKGMIEEALKTQSPELFLIDLRALDVEEVSDGFYSDAYLRNDTDSLKYSINRIKTIRYSYGIEQPDLINDISEYFDFIMYHSNWQNLNGLNFEYRNNDVVNIYKGFKFITWAFHSSLEQNDFSDVEYEIPLSEKTEGILIDLLEYCRQKNLNVLFVLNPFLQSSPETRARYNYVQRLVNEYGYEFFDTNDYYDEMGIDFSHDFYDNNHVNYYGAQKYTVFLANYIKNNYSVTDRRDDSRYSDWYSGYEVWEIAAEEQKDLIDESIAGE